ncbi:hypothetical protein DV515_00009274 [Chloebia gouldiae]|uniref:Uncharacterized protein n=1 Tax=Chloebia gouldiae TaxID=44316 RepID=A0A3L8SD43_CHLGU|nr:hypothetical protein DV515_00009274 [Chloebia gouldiae]
MSTGDSFWALISHLLGEELIAFLLHAGVTFSKELQGQAINPMYMFGSCYASDVLFAGELKPAGCEEQPSCREEKGVRLEEAFGDGFVEVWQNLQRLQSILQLY